MPPYQKVTEESPLLKPRSVKFGDSEHSDNTEVSLKEALEFRVSDRGQPFLTLETQNLDTVSNLDNTLILLLC